MEEQVLDLGGRRVRLLRGGAGPPLVLCHGFMGSAENFEDWFEELSTVRSLVVPDLPGCGATAPLPGGHTAEALAGTVLALTDRLGLERFDLGGLCLGAAVACAVARRRPDAVDRLILHTPLLAPDLVRRRFHLQVAAMTTPGLFPAVLWLSRRRLVSDLYKRLLVEGSDVDPRAADVNFANQRRADPRAIREWLRDGLRRHDADLVAGRQGETLLLVAGEDRIADAAALRSLAQAWPRVHLAVVDDAGHGWTAAYVRRQLALITAFLDGRPLPPAATGDRAA
jgi:pimeloyl-ACP methyl ester carboxylesterase